MAIARKGVRLPALPGAARRAFFLPGPAVRPKKCAAGDFFGDSLYYQGVYLLNFNVHVIRNRVSSLTYTWEVSGIYFLSLIFFWSETSFWSEALIFRSEARRAEIFGF